MLLGVLIVLAVEIRSRIRCHLLAMASTILLCLIIIAIKLAAEELVVEFEHRTMIIFVI